MAGSISVERIGTDTFEMDFFRFGRGSMPFVILPGLSVQSVMLFAEEVAEAYSAFEDAFTVYVIDRARVLPVSYTVDDMARDTAEAMRALGLERVCLFGASQGGMIAMKIAASAPSLVGKLILGSTAACAAEADSGVLDEWVRLAKCGKREALYLSFGEAIYPHDVFEASRGALIEAAKAVSDDELSRFVILAEGMRGFDARDDLLSIVCPVLVIGSEDDRVLGAAPSRRIARCLGDRAELYMYDGYGHAAYDTAPDYKERILKFLLA